MKRNYTIDIIKGTGIVLMVMGHAYFPLTHFIYLFHMAIFFIASGYFFDSGKIDTAKKLNLYAIRKIKALYIPFVVGNVIYIFLNNFL